MKEGKPKKKTIVGTVISDKMDKTITVQWETSKKHRLYKKYIKYHTKLKAHDAKNEASVGDLVKVIEAHPLSKEKSWRLVEVLKKAQEGQQR